MLALDLQFSNITSAGMGVIPAVDLCLTAVAPSQLCEHGAWTPKGSWTGTFDVALWLRSPAGVMEPLQLVLRYEDASGMQTVYIDRCSPGSHRTVLLNGSVPVRVQGAVRDAGLYLMGVDPDIVIALEEWHLVPQIRRSRLRSRAA
jgi:hypothetical protein